MWEVPITMNLLFVLTESPAVQSPMQNDE